MTPPNQTAQSQHALHFQVFWQTLMIHALCAIITPNSSDENIIPVSCQTVLAVAGILNGNDKYFKALIYIKG